MTVYTTRDHICRAALESVCFQIRDVSEVVQVLLQNCNSKEQEIMLFSMWNNKLFHIVLLWEIDIV